MAVTDALEQTTTTEYDAEGNVTALTDPEANRTSFVYGELNRLVRETNTLGFSRTFAYDAVGQLLRATDANSTIHYDYDEAGQLLSVDTTGTPGVPSVLLTYAYDAVGNRLSTTDLINGVLQGTTSYGYDALNRMTRITQSGAGVTEKRVDLGYNAVGQMEQVSRYADLDGNQRVAQSISIYDPAGRLPHLVHEQGENILAAYAYTYDEANRITQMVSPDGSSTYTYDLTSQLTGADHSYQNDEAYSYDANGNWTNEGYETGPNNRLLSDGRYNYEYDAEGNLTKQTEIATGQVTILEWDYRNRLSKVTELDVEGNVLLTAEYIYDLNNRRIAKLVDPDGEGPAPASAERFVYDNEHIALVQRHNLILG